MIDASHYASGYPTRNPDVLIYHLCKAFGCLPSDLDDEEYGVMEKMAIVDAVYQAKLREANAGN